MKSLIVLVAIFAVSSAAIISSSVKKCHRKDPNINECLMKILQENWSTFVKGDPKNHVVSLKPFQVLELAVNVSNLMSGRLINGNISGFDEIEFKSISFDQKNNKFEAWYYQPYIHFLGPYELNGQIVNTYLHGNGFANVTFFGLMNHFEMSYGFKEINGQKHLEVLNANLEFTESDYVLFDLGNLFDGNKFLSDQVHDMLNNNSKAVFRFLAKDLSYAIGQLFKVALQMMFDRVPFHYFFN